MVASRMHSLDTSVAEVHPRYEYGYDAKGNLDKIIHANGIVSDYEYDELNRLKDLTHYSPDSTPETLSDNEIAQRYAYDYYADGNKSRETFTDAEGNTHTWDWVYDQLGRLIRETHDNTDDSLDYDTFYKYDLVGNRLEKSTDNDLDGIIDEVIKGKFDQNDRLLNETRVLDGVETERTDYVYNRTEQIAKTVTNLISSRVESKTSMTYNEQGRLSKIVKETYTNGTKSQVVTQDYTYDSSGIKIRQVEKVDADADGTVDATRDISYLNDAQNHTGYSQVLEERCVENGEEVKVTTYTIGHDVLAQFSKALGYLAILSDGHGSTRAVANSAGEILQQYSYDAYGNALGFDASKAYTNLLYSGEQFNPVSGLQYLRARWYNPQSGRFNRLDPFSGNQQSPLSFHKYAYAHMNPIMGTDPSGLLSTGFMVTIGIIAGLAAIPATASLATWIGYAFHTDNYEFLTKLAMYETELSMLAELRPRLPEFSTEGKMNRSGLNEAVSEFVKRYAQELRNHREKVALDNPSRAKNIFFTGWFGNAFGFGCSIFSADMLKIGDIKVGSTLYFQMIRHTPLVHKWTEVRTGDLPKRNPFDRGWHGWALTGWETGVPSIWNADWYWYSR